MAHLAGSSDPLIFLVGRILTKEETSDTNSIQVQVGHNSVVDAPIELADFLDFISTPRLESEVLAWISEAEGTAQDLEGLISSGRLRRVSGETLPEQLNSLKGLRLVPLGFPVDVPSAGGEVVYVAREEGSTQVRPISALLGAELWNSQSTEDLPSTVARQQANGSSRENLARMAMNDVKMLLSTDLAWLGQADTKRGNKLQRLLGSRTKGK